MMVMLLFLLLIFQNRLYAWPYELAETTSPTTVVNWTALENMAVKLETMRVEICKVKARIADHLDHTSTNTSSCGCTQPCCLTEYNFFRDLGFDRATACDLANIVVDCVVTNDDCDSLGGCPA